MDVKRQGIIYIRALLFSAVLSAVLLLLIAWIIYKTDLSDLVKQVCIIVVYLTGTFLGGLLTGKKEEKKRFLWGAGFGLLYFFVVLGISACLGGIEGTNWAEKIRILLVCVLGGTLGGMLS